MAIEGRYVLIMVEAARCSELLGFSPPPLGALGMRFIAGAILEENVSGLWVKVEFIAGPDGKSVTPEDWNPQGDSAWFVPWSDMRSAQAFGTRPKDPMGFRPKS